MKNRLGSYKKVLFCDHALKDNENYLNHALSAVLEKELDPWDKCALYMLLFLRIRHAKNWLQKKVASPSALPHHKKLLDIIPQEFNLNNWEKEKLEGLSTHQLFSAYNLKGIPLAINRSMENWSAGKWNIVLLDYIPSSLRLLKLQVQNKRCVTIITKPEEISSLVLEARDPLSFVLHDLDHADHFFNHESILKGQLGFYQRACDIYEDALLTEALNANAEFSKEFNYVVSDMNAYVIHLLKCFKAAFTNHKIDLFMHVISLWDANENVSIALDHLNTPLFTHEDESVLVSFFENSQGIYV